MQQTAIHTFSPPLTQLAKYGNIVRYLATLEVLFRRVLGIHLSWRLTS